MRKSKVIKIDDREITVNELTVAQVTALMEGAGKKTSATTAELLMPNPIPIEAVSVSTGISVDDLNGTMTPSELAMVWEAVAEVNDFLSQMMQRLQVVAETLMAPKASGELPAA